MTKVKLNLDLIVRSKISHKDQKALIDAIDQVLRDMMWVGAADAIEILDYLDQYSVDEMNILSHEIL